MKVKDLKVGEMYHVPNGWFYQSTYSAHAILAEVVMTPMSKSRILGNKMIYLGLKKDVKGYESSLNDLGSRVCLFGNKMLCLESHSWQFVEPLEEM
jgi:hypothetical protein